MFSKIKSRFQSAKSATSKKCRKVETQYQFNLPDEDDAELVAINALIARREKEALKAQVERELSYHRITVGQNLRESNGLSFSVPRMPSCKIVELDSDEPQDLPPRNDEPVVKTQGEKDWYAHRHQILTTATISKEKKWIQHRNDLGYALQCGIAHTDEVARTKAATEAVIADEQIVMPVVSEACDGQMILPEPEQCTVEFILYKIPDESRLIPSFRFPVFMDLGLKSSFKVSVTVKNMYLAFEEVYNGNIRINNYMQVYSKMMIKASLNQMISTVDEINKLISSGRRNRFGHKTIKCNEEIEQLPESDEEAQLDRPFFPKGDVPFKARNAKKSKSLKRVNILSGSSKAAKLPISTLSFPRPALKSSSFVEEEESSSVPNIRDFIEEYIPKRPSRFSRVRNFLARVFVCGRREY